MFLYYIPLQNVQGNRYGKNKLYDNERKLTKRFLQERPINDVYPYMFDENESENELEQDEREERSSWNEVRKKPSNEYVKNKPNGMRYRRGLDLNDYNSENDDARANIEVLPRSKSGVRNVPGNKYEHRRGICRDRNNKFYRKRREFSEEHDFLGFKKESSKVTEDKSNKKDDRASHNIICSDDTLPDPINAISETKFKMAAKKILFNKDFVNQGEHPKTTCIAAEDGTNREKRSMKLSIIDDNNLIKSVKHDSSSNSLILTLKMKDGKSKLRSSETTESKIKQHSRSNLPPHKHPKKHKGFDVMELVSPEPKYTAKPTVKRPIQNKVDLPQEMAIIYRVDESENNNRDSQSNYPLVAEKQNRLEDIDEPTSAIEQHELSTRPYLTPSTTTEDFFSTTMEILKFKFADILTTPAAEGQFVVKESSDMVHGKILQKVHNLDKRTFKATYKPKARKKNFPLAQPRLRRRIAYNNYDYGEIDKLQDKLLDIKNFFNDRDSGYENEMVTEISQFKRNSGIRKDRIFDSEPQDNSYEYEEMQAIQSRNNFRNRRLLSFSEDGSNSMIVTNDNNKYGDLDYENGRSYHMNESGFSENKIRVKRNPAELLDLDDDEYSEDTVDDYSPIYNRKRSDDYAYEEEGDSAVGETQTYKEKKEDKSRTFDLSFYTAKSDDGEFTLADSFKSGATTPLNLKVHRFKDSDLYRNRIKALTKVIHEKINKKNNKNSNFNAFKRMVEEEVDRGCGDCKSEKCPNCHNKHCKQCKKVKLSTDDDENLDKPDILKKIENLSTRLQLLNNEHEYWEKYRTNNYYNGDLRKPQRSDNSTDREDNFNDSKSNKTKSEHNDDDEPKQEKPKHDEDLDSSENKTHIPEHTTTESEKQTNITTHKPTEDNNHNEKSTETTHKTTSSKKKVTEKPSNTTTQESPKEEDESFEPKTCHNGTNTTASTNSSSILSLCNKKKIKKHFKKMYETARDRSNSENEMDSNPIEVDSSETVGFAHHPTKAKSNHYNISGKHILHSIRKEDLPRKLYWEYNKNLHKSDNKQRYFNNDNEIPLKGFRKRYENRDDKEEFGDLLFDDKPRKALDPETNEDESLAEFSINVFKHRNNSSRSHHHLKHKQIYTKKKSHRGTGNSSTEKYAIQLEKDESDSDNKDKINRREIRNLKNLHLDTVDSFDDVVEENESKKKINKREIVEAKELKKSIQEMKQRADPESYVKGSTNGDINDAPFERFSKFSEGYWKINPDRNLRRIKSRNSPYGNFKKRSNIFRKRLPITRLNKIKTNYYNQFLNKNHKSNPYRLNRYRRDTPNASKQKQPNQNNDKPIKVVETKGIKEKHENEKKLRKSTKGKTSQWLGTNKSKPKCNTHLLGTDLGGINPNTALKTSQERPVIKETEENVCDSNSNFFSRILLMILKL